MSQFHPPGDCPVCGAEVPEGAKACPECGACAQTGWGEDSHLDGIDLPGEEEEAVPADEERKQAPGVVPLTVVVVLVLILSGLWFLL